jgi:prevent-host-death family protein
MERQMSATQARVNFGEVLRYVTEEQQPIIVERAGKPHAVIMGIEEYERLKITDDVEPDWRVALERARKLREQIAARRGDEPLPDVVEIIHQMREERDAQLMETCGLR